ncbi:MAG: TolC family protein [Dehalococcoidia bacterium]
MFVPTAVLTLVLAASAAAGAEAPTPEAEMPDFYAEEPALHDYAAEALRANPSVQEALARYRAVLEKAPQVTSLPDPKLGFTQAIRSVETRVGPQRNALMLTQAFPWFGKLDLRGQVVLQEAAARRQLYLARQREVLSQVKTHFYALGYIDTALRITQEEQSVLSHYERLAQTRYASGQGLQQAVIKIQAEITKVMNRLYILQQRRVSVAARLNTLMDRPPHAPLPAVEPLSLPEVSLDLPALYELGEQNRQELKAAEALVKKSERSIELARKDFWPNLSVSAGLVNIGGRGDPAGLMQPPPDDGKNAFNLSLGLSIPLWRGKYRAGVREATLQMSAQRMAHARVRNEMEFAIQDQTIRLETLREQVDLFESVLIPQAEETLSSTEAAYQTGQLGVLDLLDSERVLLSVRLTNAQYHSDFLSALAKLERALGTRFPEVRQP